MQILEHEDERRATGGDLEERSPRSQQCRPVRHLGLSRPYGRRQELDLAIQRLQTRAFEPDADGVADRERSRVIRHADQAIEDAAQRPVGEPLTVWKALSDRHGGARLDRGQALEELFEQPRLPHARRGNHADEERTQLVEGPTGHQLELLQVWGTADQRCARCHGEDRGPP